MSLYIKPTPERAEAEKRWEAMRKAMKAHAELEANAPIYVHRTKVTLTGMQPSAEEIARHNAVREAVAHITRQINESIFQVATPRKDES